MHFLMKSILKNNRYHTLKFYCFVVVIVFGIVEHNIFLKKKI